MRPSTLVIVVCLALWAGGCGGEYADEFGAPLAVESTVTPWQSGQSSGRIVTTRHYRIFTTTKRQAVLNRLPGFMEAAHDNYLRLTGLPDAVPKEALTVYMMATRSEWALLTENVTSVGREAFLSIEAGGYYHKGACVFWDIGGMATFLVAAHEGLHQFLDMRLKDRLPMWLEEGLCVSAEGHEMSDGYVRFTLDRNSSRFVALRNAIIQQHWIPIERLLPMDAGDIITKGTERSVSYYGQLWAMSMLLRNHPRYSQGVKRLLADAEAGRLASALGATPEAMARVRRMGRAYNRLLSEPIFRHYITDDLSAFDGELLAFAKGHVGLK